MEELQIMIVAPRERRGRRAGAEQGAGRRDHFLVGHLNSGV